MLLLAVRRSRTVSILPPSSLAWGHMTGSVASHVPPSASPASASPNARGYYPWRAIHSSLASSTCSRPIVPVRYIPPRPPPTPRPHVEPHPAVATLFIPVRDENRIEGNGSRKHSVEERTNSPDKRSCWTGCPREQAAHDPYYSDEKATPDRIGFRHVFCQIRIDVDAEVPKTGAIPSGEQIPAIGIQARRVVERPPPIHAGHPGPRRVRGSLGVPGHVAVTVEPIGHRVRTGKLLRTRV